MFSPIIYFYRANQYTFPTRFHVIHKYSLNIRKETCFFSFLHDLIIKIVNFHGWSEKLWREFCQLIMFAIWYLPRFGNLFIQSAAKCTCTNFILQKSETFLCQSLRNHWKTFPQQRRENRWQQCQTTETIWPVTSFKLFIVHLYMYTATF